MHLLDADSQRREQAVARYADILERFGIQARLDRVVTAVGASTGGLDWAEGFRNTNVLPLVASRNRRSVLRDLQYWMMHVVDRPVRYGVVTFGANVDLYGPLRETIQAGQRRISKWAAWARDEFGVNVVGRFGEMTVNENLSFHPHANVIYWLDRAISKDRWRAFLTGSWTRFGARWKDNGVVRDASEIVKYFAKGDDLSLLADMACQVRGWVDREVRLVHTSQPSGEFPTMKKFQFASCIGIAGVLVSGAAHAAGPIDDLFAGVDLSGVTTNVTTIGIAVVGIVLAYKAIELVKRAVSKT